MTANAAAAAVSLMVMFEDQSVVVRSADGSTTLLVSPCGAEVTVLLLRGASAAHPLHAAPRPLRQRTRFAISTYKVLDLVEL